MVYYSFFKQHTGSKCIWIKTKLFFVTEQQGILSIMFIYHFINEVFKMRSFWLMHILYPNVLLQIHIQVLKNWSNLKHWIYFLETSAFVFKNISVSHYWVLENVTYAEKNEYYQTMRRTNKKPVLIEKKGSESLLFFWCPLFLYNIDCDCSFHVWTHRWIKLTYY